MDSVSSRFQPSVRQASCEENIEREAVLLEKVLAAALSFCDKARMIFRQRRLPSLLVALLATCSCSDDSSNTNSSSAGSGGSAGSSGHGGASGSAGSSAAGSAGTTSTVGGASGTGGTAGGGGGTSGAGGSVVGGSGGTAGVGGVAAGGSAGVGGSGGLGTTGESCSDPIPLTLGSSVYTFSASEVDHLTGSLLQEAGCTATDILQGPDIVFSFTPNATGTVTAQVDALSDFIGASFRVAAILHDGACTAPEIDAASACESQYVEMPSLTVTLPVTSGVPVFLYVAKTDTSLNTFAQSEVTIDLSLE